MDRGSQVTPGLSRPLTPTALALVALAVVVGLILLLATAGPRRTHWAADCEERGGHVVAEPRYRDNPLIAESADPVYRCDRDGVVLTTFRG